MKKGVLVELIEDTDFYKKGTRAVVMKTSNGSDKLEIRYENETYLGRDVDIMPSFLFRVVE